MVVASTVAVVDMVAKHYLDELGSKLSHTFSVVIVVDLWSICEQVLLLLLL